jgi:hypothetical protein
LDRAQVKQPDNRAHNPSGTPPAAPVQVSANPLGNRVQAQRVASYEVTDPGQNTLR